MQEITKYRLDFYIFFCLALSIDVSMVLIHRVFCWLPSNGAHKSLLIAPMLYICYEAFPVSYF